MTQAQDRRIDSRPRPKVEWTDEKLIAAAVQHLMAESSAACLLHAPGTDPQLYVAVGTKDALRGLLQDEPEQASRAQHMDDARLSNEEIDLIWQSMPGGPTHWLKGFGYQQFAKAVEDEVLLSVQRAAPSPAKVDLTGLTRYGFDDYPGDRFHDHADGKYVKFADVEQLLGSAAAAPLLTNEQIVDLMLCADKGAATVPVGVLIHGGRAIERELRGPSPVSRDAVLEEAAEAVERLGESSGDAAAYDHREPYPHEVEREFAIEVCAKTIRALKSSQPVPVAGEARDAALERAAVIVESHCVIEEEDAEDSKEDVANWVLRQRAAQIRALKSPPVSPVVPSEGGVLEEAARICDWHAEDANYGPAIATAKKCADAIRALRSSPGVQGEGSEL